MKPVHPTGNPIAGVHLPTLEGEQMGCSQPVLCDASFWAQIAVAAGTLALAAAAFRNESMRRRETEAVRFGDAVEDFLAPTMEDLLAIHTLSQPQYDPYRPGLAEASHRINARLRHARHKAFRVSTKTLNSLWYVERVAVDVVGLLDRLKQRESAILDNVGSQVSGQEGRREHPRVRVQQAGKDLLWLEGAQLFELWLKRLRLADYLLFVSDEFNPDQRITTETHHGKTTVANDQKLTKLQGTLFARMKDEAELVRLPQRLDELRLESERTKKEIAGILDEYAEHATH